MRSRSPQDEEIKRTGQQSTKKTTQAVWAASHSRKKLHINNVERKKSGIAAKKLNKREPKMTTQTNDILFCADYNIPFEQEITFRPGSPAEEISKKRKELLATADQIRGLELDPKVEEQVLGRIKDVLLSWETTSWDGIEKKINIKKGKKREGERVGALMQKAGYPVENVVVYEDADGLLVVTFTPTVQGVFGLRSFERWKNGDPMEPQEDTEREAVPTELSDFMCGHGYKLEMPIYGFEPKFVVTRI